MNKRVDLRRRANPNLVKVNYSYTVVELAFRLGVHKNTVRHWQAKGLKPIDGGRPALFQGAHIREFLTGQRQARKCPCPPGTFYCFTCREPREPALDMVDYIEQRRGYGNLRALCCVCETTMYRRASVDALAAVMPGIDVQFSQAPSRLEGCPNHSLNCDSERQGKP